MVLIHIGAARVRMAGYVAALCLLVASCAAPPERLAAAADPAARVSLTAYRPVLEGYRRQRPVEPASWREQNERVSPGEKR